MKKTIILVLAALWLMAGAMGAGAQEKGKAFLWDGAFWKQVSLDAKLGYIGGMANLADFEMGAGKGKAPCISRAFAEELTAHTPQQIVQEVDKFYQEHPDNLKATVIEVVLQRCTKVCQAQPGVAAPKK